MLRERESWCGLVREKERIHTIESINNNAIYSTVVGSIYFIPNLNYNVYINCHFYIEHLCQC